MREHPVRGGHRQLAMCDVRLGARASEEAGRQRGRYWINSEPRSGVTPSWLRSHAGEKLRFSANVRLMRRTLILSLLWISILPGFAAGKHRYLFVWVGDDDKKASDFLTVIDADPASAKYGQVVATAPTGTAAAVPHHTEDSLPPNQHLLANGFEAGETWLFDLREPLVPRVLTSFGELDGYNHPHTYIRLRNGDVVATFQYHGDHHTGGLVEFDERGKVIHSGSAVDPHAPNLLIEPYSVVALPAIDRAISTDTSMMDHARRPGGKVQLWRLSDLKLLSTFELPPGPHRTENQWTGEPRLLADGSVYVHTFHCGLYRLTALETTSPHASFVHRFEGDGCGVPIVISHWWLQTVPEAHAVVTLDIADADHPREVGRLTLDEKQGPHWIALEPGGKRIVINSGEYAEHRVFIANFNPQTGSLTLDERFRDRGSNRPGVSMDGKRWPHGFKGNAYPHGAVFSR